MPRDEVAHKARQQIVGREYRAERPITPRMNAQRRALAKLRALRLRPRQVPRLMELYTLHYLSEYS